MKYLKAFGIFVLCVIVIMFLRTAIFKSVAQPGEAMNHIIRYWELQMPSGDVELQEIKEGDENYRYTILKVAKDAELKDLDHLGFRNEIDDESQKIIDSVYDVLNIPDDKKFVQGEDLGIKKVVKDEDILVILTNKSIPKYYFFEYAK